jgi:hypothetical protein
MGKYSGIQREYNTVISPNRRKRPLKRRNYTQWIVELKRGQKEQKYGYRLCNSEKVIKKTSWPIFYLTPKNMSMTININ